MASGKEIRTQIKSIKNTQKITSAMEMVAASKMRRAQESMRATRPYATKIRNVVSHLAQAHPEYKHTFMIEREVKRVGFIVISSDRGLCGGLNANEFRVAVNKMKELDEQGIGIDVGTIGKKSTQYFKRLKGNLRAETSGLGDRPRLEDIIGVVKVMLDAYEEGEIDQLFVVYNEFVNTMTQSPQLDQILPISVVKVDKEIKHHWDYIYEPDSRTVLEGLLMRYIESQVYQGMVENIACEMAARMIAMKSATDNAGDIIDGLELVYNKARQAAITQEISEIVSGASAV